MSAASTSSDTAASAAPASNAPAAAPAGGPWRVLMVAAPKTVRGLEWFVTEQPRQAPSTTWRLLTSFVQTQTQWSARIGSTVTVSSLARDIKGANPPPGWHEGPQNLVIDSVASATPLQTPWFRTWWESSRGHRVWITLTPSNMGVAPWKSFDRVVFLPHTFPPTADGSVDLRLKNIVSWLFPGEAETIDHIAKTWMELKSSELAEMTEDGTMTIRSGVAAKSPPATAAAAAGPSTAPSAPIPVKVGRKPYRPRTIPGAPAPVATCERLWVNAEVKWEHKDTLEALATDIRSRIVELKPLLTLLNYNALDQECVEGQCAVLKLAFDVRPADTDLFTLFIMRLMKPWITEGRVVSGGVFWGEKP